jgi:uroporphyrinogen decarboxylase
MNRRQAVIDVMSFKERHPVPYTVWWDANTRQRLEKYFAVPDWEQRLGNYIVRLSLAWEPKQYLAPGRYRDIHGTVWQEGHPLHIVEPALKAPSLEHYDIPDYLPLLMSAADEPFDASHGIVPCFGFEQMDDYLRLIGRDVYTVVMYGQGLLERAWMIRGLENFLSDLVLEPRFVEALLDRILERQLELLEKVLKLPCDAILTADDFGDQRGIMIGPERWRKLFKPRYRILWEKIHRAGKKVFHHTCGNVFDIIGDLAEAGLDCLQSVQPEAIPVYEIERCYGKILTLWGGLGTQALLPFGTPEAIRTETRRLKQELGRGGGYVFTSAKPIMSEVPLENALALIEETMGPKQYAEVFLDITAGKR